LFEIVDADLSLPLHGDAVVHLLHEYASDPMGGGNGLPPFAKKYLVGELRKCDSAYVVLAFEGSTPAGIVVCFEAFSTFACRPLLNLHDVVVSTPYRGKGLCRQMLATVEQHAKKIGCCKLTLEVLEGNATAQAVYRSFGFANYELDPTIGKAMFWEKKLV